jgi:hypothetical protein
MIKVQSAVAWLMYGYARSQDPSAEGDSALSSRIRRLIVWFFGTLVAAVVPLGFIYADLLQKREPHGVSDVLSSGELILISGVVALGSVGELLGEKGGNAKDSGSDRLTPKLPG